MLYSLYHIKCDWISFLLLLPVVDETVFSEVRDSLHAHHDTGQTGWVSQHITSPTPHLRNQENKDGGCWTRGERGGGEERLGRGEERGGEERKRGDGRRDGEGGRNEIFVLSMSCIRFTTSPPCRYEL